MTTAVTACDRPTMGAGRNATSTVANIAVDEVSASQKSAMARVATFSQLPMNWDSYGSGPIAEDVVEAAWQLIRRAAPSHWATLIVEPISGGAVLVDWESGERRVSFEVRPDLVVDLLLVDGDEMIEASLDSPASAVPNVDRLIDWVETQ